VRAVGVVVLVCCADFTRIAYGGSFVAFESGQVRPLALAADGSRSFVANTPDNHLDIFAIQPDGSLLRETLVAVG